MAEDQTQLVAQFSFFICSFLSNMFRPHLLGIFMESYAAMYQLRIISCGYSCCCVYSYYKF